MYSIVENDSYAPFKYARNLDSVVIFFQSYCTRTVEPTAEQMFHLDLVSFALE
jgi:hypothetical protein